MRNLIIFISTLAIFSGCVSLQENKWTSLFDGKTLNGWHAQPGGKWEVLDGVIIGKSEKAEKRHGLLVSDKTYSNFIVRLKFKVNKGDSGFYFRGLKTDTKAGIKGFQVEVDSSNETGGLYETGGRAWVVKPEQTAGKSFYTPGEWSSLELLAQDSHILVKINGQKTAELTDDLGRRMGHFALQLHGNMNMDVEYKDIEIQEL